MRPFVIEFIHEIVEAGLLRQAVSASRLRCFFFQGEMPALMAAILLGVAWLDAFNGDAKPQPKDGEPGQIIEAIR